MFFEIQERCKILTQNFPEIPEHRKSILDQITAYIRTAIQSNKPVRLEFICTHNSRRSHLGQVWAAVAADFYEVNNVNTFSGGTQATAFHPNAIAALTRAGFEIKKTTENTNPVYHVHYSNQHFISCFSKVYSHAANPKSEFVAIMTCSEAEKNCPLIQGCELRIAVTYNDPKTYDHSILQDEKYTEKSNQIALECLYIFSKVNS